MKIALMSAQLLHTGFSRINFTLKSTIILLFNDSINKIFKEFDNVALTFETPCTLPFDLT